MSKKLGSKKFLGIIAIAVISIVAVIVVINLVSSFVGNNRETGRLEVNESFTLDLSILGRINNISMSFNFRVNAPNISGSADAEAFTNNIKNQLNTLTNNIYDVNRPVEQSFIKEINYYTVLNPQLRSLSVIINTLTIIDGVESRELIAAGFRTNNGRRLNFNDAFSRNAVPALVAELNNRLPTALAGLNEPVLNNLIINNEHFTEVINNHSWYFTEEELVVVFNNLAAGGAPLTLTIPISFLRSNRLVR
ncbi:MAG: hypothetical protein FWE37_05345 [Spirochaetaceae bacterium]|nr:hypothetical protein [Spirochaetaceae bacterium]